MEAPGKIYRTTIYLDNDRGKTLWKTEPVAGAENIEYIRDDTFIEKALTYLHDKLHFDNVFYGIVSTDFNSVEEMYEDFKNYMKGE